MKSSDYLIDLYDDFRKEWNLGEWTGVVKGLSHHNTKYCKWDSYIQTPIDFSEDFSRLVVYLPFVYKNIFIQIGHY